MKRFEASAATRLFFEIHPDQSKGGGFPSCCEFETSVATVDPAEPNLKKPSGPRKIRPLPRLFAVFGGSQGSGVWQRLRGSRHPDLAIALSDEEVPPALGTKALNHSPALDRGEWPLAKK